jgi:hypothetical protein
VHKSDFGSLSIPIMAIALCAVAAIGVLALAGQEHGRTIPLTDIELGEPGRLRCAILRRHARP